MRVIGVGLAALAVSPAAAQQAPTPAPATSPQAAQAAAQADDAGADEPDIIVRGTRTLPGSVIGDIPPEEQLGPADIRSYGVSSVADLLTELAPQTRSGRGGAPVVLVNGRRISGFQEIRDLPTEAIARVDILPEEVALKYGYRADQRVVNFVLRRRFRAATVELADRIPTAGGRNTANPQLDLLNIRGNNRVNLHLQYNASSPLTEAERGITQQSSLFTQAGNVVVPSANPLDPPLVFGVPVAAGGGVPTIADFTGVGATAADQGRYRTLLSSSRAFGANAVYARTFGQVGATFNGTLDVNSSTGQQGLPTATLTLPAGNPYSPFGQTVLVDRALAGFNPLQQRNESIAAHLGTTFNGALGGWQWNLTGNYDRTVSDTFTDLGVDVAAFQTRLNAGDRGANPYALLGAGDAAAIPGNRGHSLSSQGAVNALLTGSAFQLPAGPVTTSLRIGASTSDFSSRSFRAGLTTTGQVSRDIVNGQLNVDLPITSRSRDVLSAIGSLSLNGNVGVEQLSDFGTLTTLGYGANWSPVDGVRFLASHTDDENAPSAAQLGNPTVVTPNVRVFDYVRGANANVTTVTGGNPGLVSNNVHSTKFGLTAKPFGKTDLTFVANYVSTRTDNPIQSFPTPTAIIEAAFPQRFLRDGSGQLIQLDSRPINFARRSSSELRYGFDLAIPLKSQIQRQIEAFRAGTGPNPFAGLRFPGAPGGQGRRPGAGGDAAPSNGGNAPGAAQTPPADSQAATAPPGRGFGGRGPGGGGGGRFGGGGFGGRGGGQGGGRLQFALYHTWHFTDRVDIGQNGPFIDLLNGDAIGQTGGQPRHELEGQAGYSNNGLGARLSVNFQSGTTVNGGTAAAPTTLDFSSLTTANLRLFADLGQRLELLKKHPWLRGTRVTLSVDNLFNRRQSVTDANGTTPIAFQPGYLDPLGRSIRLSIRKIFF